MSAQNESHSAGAIWAWFASLAPVLYLALFLPLLSLVARSGSRDCYGSFHTFYGLLPEPIYISMYYTWSRMDPDADRAMRALWK